ncbi:hypothetical protein [Oceaniradius stylonematis]|jgi:hypothetical protein|uniref:hypothetical protein n=1 Tax=Oceaniradius stylonematis TaxID=2184161 RepID=UPI00273D36A1|nr:hypothetical protein [Oceaniradius stylonematis]
MKNRLSALAAGTALCAIMAAPAGAGYTIYEDSAMPSVLFFEFDDMPGDDPTVISAPSGTAPPVVLNAPMTEEAPGATDDDRAEMADDDDEPLFSQSSGVGTIDNERMREIIIEDAIRDEVLRDVQLR